ncbi:uncharacterized protein BJ212DRAFT_1486466 [Suillus subaureus]|uniref:C2 domain-containing protein n=1 Tax=Suillus subaureus TaxID=48587 RepID=A0A9P7J6C2_9AGAM|nr:uncharacterized protein BJ212DRAFT_1486466 [Suillus subaureus]KAG1805351.1 hypothetical protein BJ212DRAFT_1486466 [Suillus subaureus]
MTGPASWDQRHIDLHHLPKIGWSNVDHQFYIEISIHDDNTGTTSRTSLEKPSSMPWSSKYFFNVRNSTTLTLKVFAHRQLHDDQYIGMVQGCVEEFLRYPGAILEQLKCVKPQGKEELLRASLEFKLTPVVGAGKPAHGSQPTKTGHREGIWKGPIASQPYGDTVNTPFPLAVQIFDIDLHHLPQIHLFSTYDSFYVNASVDDHDYTSTTAENLNSLPWVTELKLNVQASSIISLKVFAKRRFHEDQYIGMVQEGVETLLAHSRTKIYHLMSFDPHGNKHFLCASIEFKIMPLHNTIENNTTQHAEDQVARTIGASKDIPDEPATGGNVPNALSKAPTEQVLDVAVSEVLTPLLDKINIFVQLAGKFAEAHPYTKMAFMILTAVYHLVDAQFARDRSINRLITVMHETYGLVSGVEELKRVASQEKTINSLARQTIECSYFIRDYMQNRSGWKQSFANALSTLDDKILAYEATFKELKNAIQQQVAINTQLYVFRIHDLLLDHATKTDLDGMHYAFGASIESQKIGEAPPRTDIVESITSWVNEDDEQQICLLLGPKGSGKSTIAHTIARQFEVIMRLGSSYCFSRAARDKRNTTNLFSTIARDLADHDSHYMKALWATVKDKRALRETINPLTQFERFILIPANQMTCIGPVLVIIDGLEHSGSESNRRDLLTALAEKGAGLPRNFKLLVTCRPEEDICAAFKGKSHVIQKHLNHHADPLFVSPPISRQNGSSGPRFRPPTPPLSIPEFTRHNPLLGADSSTSDSTPISDTSGSGSAVSAVFDTWGNDRDSTESPPSSSSSVDEEPQPSKRGVVVQVTRRSQEFITVEQISETGDRTVRRTNSEKLESWTVKPHDHSQSGLLLNGFVASAEPANDLPPLIGLSGYSSRPSKQSRQKQVRAKTIIRHSTNVDGAEILGRVDDLACR